MRWIGVIVAGAVQCVALAACSHAADSLPSGPAALVRGAGSMGAAAPAAPAKRTAAYEFHVVTVFTGVNGSSPQDNLTSDAAGNLYGTAALGYHRVGTVFKIAKSGKQQILYNFNENVTEPAADVVMDAQGNVYGTATSGQTTLHGNFSDGGIYKVTPKGIESVLHAFTGGADGNLSFSNLVFDGSGDLYGTASLGGSINGQCAPSGCGVVFEIAADGTYSVVHTFMGADGNEPYSGVTFDAQGDLYGTTLFGGSAGYGTVYKIDPSGGESVVYSFTNRADGGEPTAGVILDGAGNLYGTATTGGKNLQACDFGPSVGCGTVFAIDPAGHETTLHEFGSMPDGAQPYGGLILDGAGNLYGTAREGGKGQFNGVVFEVTTGGAEFTLLHSFVFNQGEDPQGSLLMGAGGVLYGTTTQDGAGNGGTVFKLTPR